MRSAFQSHNGAIAASRHYLTLMIPLAVSIPQWCDCCFQQSPYRPWMRDSFNPTMVRLLPFGKLVWLRSDLRFQSHNGAIAAGHAKQHRQAQITVSIPQWCDCCWQTNAKRTFNFLFQSHNGAIAARRACAGQRSSLRFQSHNGAIAALPLCVVSA